MSIVSENIKVFRNTKKMTQSELGKLLGKAPSVIANWEAGTNRPDVDSIAKMCEIFGVDANTFFGWENEKATPEQISSGVNELLDKYGLLLESDSRKISEKQHDLIIKMIDVILESDI